MVLVLSADHVYRLDYSEAHRRPPRGGRRVHRRDHRGARRGGRRPRGRGGGDDDRVTDFAYKPDDPKTGTIAAEVIVYDPLVLVTVLEELHRELGADSDAGDTGLGDFGDHLVPRLVERGRDVRLGARWLLARRGPAAPLPAGAPGRAHRRRRRPRRARLADAHPAAAARARPGARRRARRGQPAQPGLPGRGHRRAQRDRPRRRRRGGRRGARQRGLRRHRGPGRRPRALGGRRHAVQHRAGRAGSASRTPTAPGTRTP